MLNRPLRNVWCVGRNYAEHARELGNEVPAEPLIFLKAGSSVTRDERVVLPAGAGEIHHELEIALEFGDDLRFRALALALDLTDRTAQNRLKSKGQPWTLAKSFRGSCPLGAAIPLPADLTGLRLRLLVNSELRQEGSSSQMLFSPETLRSFVLAHFPVEPGDWLLTGTPPGVAALKAGDQLRALLNAPDGTELLRTDWNIVLSNT